MTEETEPRIPSYQARLARAWEHLEQLVPEIRIWEDRMHSFPEDEIDPETGRVVVSLRIDVPVPDSWGPRIGDVLHNCRSALDHLAYALVEANVGYPLPEEAEKRSEFPIYSSAGSFEKQGRRAIRDMASAAQEGVESLQPYHRGADWAIDPLWLLHELSNIDKHRRPTLTALYLEPNMEVRAGTVAELDIGAPGPARHGGDPFVIGAYRLTQNEEAQVSWGYKYGIVFDEPIAWKPAYVPHLLYTIWAYIGQEVFQRLVPLLEA